MRQKEHLVAIKSLVTPQELELICAIANLKGSESVWRDIKITFTRNLPTNLTETAQVVNSLRGLVSD